MIRSLVLAAACVALFAVSASAQINSEAARRIVEAPSITPALRAQIASRLTGISITPGSTSSVFTVTAAQHIVGPVDAPTLVMSARLPRTWQSAADEIHPPRIVIQEWPTTERYAPAVLFRFQARRSVRYLVLCDMRRNESATVAARINYVDAAITWEGPRRAAFLIPPQSGDTRLNIELWVPRGEPANAGRSIELLRCEFSAIG